MKKIMFFSLLTFLIIPIYASAMICDDILRENNEYFSQPGQSSTDLACRYDSYGPENDRKHIEIYYSTVAKYDQEYYIYEVSDSDSNQSKKYHLIYCGYDNEGIVGRAPKSIEDVMYDYEYGENPAYFYKIDAGFGVEDSHQGMTVSPIGILDTTFTDDGVIAHSCFRYAGTKVHPSGVTLFAFSDVDVPTYSNDNDCEDSKCTNGQVSNIGEINLSANNFKAMGFLNYSEKDGALDESDEEKTGIAAGIRDIGYLTGVGGEETCDALLGDYTEPYTFAWYLHTALSFIKYLGPTLVVLFSAIDYIKALVASDADAMKKTNTKLFKRIVCCLLLFFIPLVLDLLFNIFKLYGSCKL